MLYIRRIGMSASQDRLEQLIAKRLESGANKDQIDARIWDLFGEEWTVMFTDLAGFSRNVAEFGIIHFLQVIHESERVLAPCIDDHDGILLKLEGDSMLVIFRRAARALDCAVAMQQTLQRYNVGKTDTEQILLCVGLGDGRMLRIGDNDVFGAEVNAAAKLGEDQARAGDILVTGSVKKAAEDDRSKFVFEALKYVPPGAESAYKLIYDQGP
jgi:adenylate cyclase